MSNDDRPADQSLESITKITWIIYWLSIGSAALAFIPTAFVLSIIVWFISLTLAFIKRSDAEGTIYASHISNIITINVVGLIAMVIFFLWIMGNPVSGLTIGSVGIIIVAIWQVYRLIKGILRMQEKKAFA